MRKSLRFGCRNVCFFLFCDGNKLISVVQSTTFTTKTQLMHQRNSLHQRRIQPQSKRSRWNYGMHPATIMPNLASFFSLFGLKFSWREFFIRTLGLLETAIRESEVTNETFSAGRNGFQTWSKGKVCSFNKERKIKAEKSNSELDALWRHLAGKVGITR